MKSIKPLFILSVFFLFIVSNLNSQVIKKKKIYIEMPNMDTSNYLKIFYNIHPGLNSKDDSYLITFHNISDSQKRNNSFLLITNKNNFKEDVSRFKKKNFRKIITINNVSDSLSAIGKSFFRKYDFHLIFIQGTHLFCHNTSGEYLHKNLTTDYIDN